MHWHQNEEQVTGRFKFLVHILKTCIRYTAAEKLMKLFSELAILSTSERNHNKHFAILFYHILSVAYSEKATNTICA